MNNKTNDKENNLARVVKIYKAQLDLTNSDIAEQSGLPENTIARICAGKTTTPKLNTLKKIAKVFNCSIDDLLGFEGGVEPYYLDKITGRISLTLKDNTELRNLLDAAIDLTPSDLQTLIGVVNMIKKK